MLILRANTKIIQALILSVVCFLASATEQINSNIKSVFTIRTFRNGKVRLKAPNGKWYNAGAKLNESVGSQFFNLNSNDSDQTNGYFDTRFFNNRPCRSKNNWNIFLTSKNPDQNGFPWGELKYLLVVYSNEFWAIKIMLAGNVFEPELDSAGNITLVYESHVDRSGRHKYSSIKFSLQGDKISQETTPCLNPPKNQPILTP